jgi:hypothetical protein
MHIRLDLEDLIDCIIGSGTTIQSIAHVAKKEALKKHIHNMFSWIHNEKLYIIFVHKKS